MPFESPQDPAADPLVSRPHRLPTPLVLAGVAGACLLGAGLGLWARPSELERALVHRPHVPPLQPPSAARRQIEIRVDGAGALAPVHATVHATVHTPAPAAPAPSRAPEPLAPKPAPEGLMRVHAVAPSRLAEAPGEAPRLAAVSDLAARAAARRRAKAAARRAQAERDSRVEAEAAAAAARKARLQKTRIAAAAEAKAREKAALKLAADKASERRLAEKAAAARAQKSRVAEAAAVRLAETRRKAEARAAAPVRTRVRASRCASTDPGAALACADPVLGAAERQLNRAYRQAQAAGVPAERLERQQQRWLAARANAARQAPWAVHDIYLSRIAELQDQTRQASQGD